MAKKFRTKIISPVFNHLYEDVDACNLRTVNGDMTILASGAPHIAILVPSIIKIKSGSETYKGVINSGISYVSGDDLMILAPSWILLGEIDITTEQAIINDAEEKIKKVEENSFNYIKYKDRIEVSKNRIEFKGKSK